MTKVKTKAQPDLLGIEPVQGSVKVGDKVTVADGPKEGGAVVAQQTGKRRKTEVAKHDPRAAAPPAKVEVVSDPFLAMVREVAMNPALDVTKLDALLAMQERILDRQARIAFDNALAEMQPHLPVIDRKGRIEIKKKDSKGDRTGPVEQSTPYPKWEDVVEAITPITSRFGFGLSFKPSLTAEKMVRVEGTLSGHGWRETTHVDLQHDATGSKNAVQAFSSSVSYGKRIVGCALLNIVSRGEDVDGAFSGAPMVVGDAMGQEQVDQLIELCEAVGCPKDRFVRHMNSIKPQGHPDAAGIAQIPVARFDQAVAQLRSYEQNAKERAVAKGGR